MAEKGIWGLEGMRWWWWGVGWGWLNDMLTENRLGRMRIARRRLWGVQDESFG